MTEYLSDYMDYITGKLSQCSDSAELQDLLREHLDKIAFMQHERIVHFLVTMLFALVLSVFIIGLLLTGNPALLILVTIILVLLIFYIKHYYFLENTVQKMYRVYDDILQKNRNIAALQEVKE